MFFNCNVGGILGIWRMFFLDGDALESLLWNHLML